MAFSGWALFVLKEFQEAKELDFDDAFIRQAIRLRFNFPAIDAWRLSLLHQGMSKEAELIYLLTRHGQSFQQTEVATTTLRHLLDTSNLSDLCDTFIRAEFCNQFRYIGLPAKSQEYGQELIGREFGDNPHLQTMILNQRHMNQYNIYYGSEDFYKLLATDTAKLAEGYETLVGIPVFDASNEHIGRSLEFGIETMALANLAYANSVIGCESEADALHKLESLLSILSNIAERGQNCRDEYMALQIYSEALWPLGRVVPFAMIRRWDTLSDRLMEVFFDGFPQASDSTRAIHNRFHIVEQTKQRSPVWIQVVILKSVREEEKAGNGADWLEKLIPEPSRHRVYGHAVLARALNSLEVLLGRDPLSIPARYALAQSESAVLLDAVYRLKEP